MGQLHPMNSSYNTNLWWSNCQDVVLGLLMVSINHIREDEWVE